MFRFSAWFSLAMLQDGKEESCGLEALATVQGDKALQQLVLGCQVCMSQQNRVSGVCCSQQFL